MMTMVVCPYQEAGCTFYVSSILFVGPEGPEQCLLRKVKALKLTSNIQRA